MRHLCSRCKFSGTTQRFALARATLPDQPVASPHPPPPPPTTSSRILHALRSLLVIVSLALISFLPSLALSLPASAQSSSSVASSSLGRKVASALRSSGWADEAIVIFISMLPVLELRGAIPVALWMGMPPAKAALLSILGNMLPVPFLLLLLQPLSDLLARVSSTAKRALDFLLDHTRAKAGPIAEHRWIGLALFVGVPLPGTGAWSGAIGAYCLGMPLVESLTANLAGVCLAAACVVLLCSLPLKQALALGVALLAGSSVMWTVLRAVKGRMSGGKPAAEE